MANSNPNRPRHFHWQGAIILLPVIVLSVAALFSLRQDRLLAEQDAKELGASIARQIAQYVRKNGGRELSDYFSAGGELQATREAVFGICAFGAGDLEATLKRIKEWQKANPEIDLSVLSPIQGEIKFQQDSILPHPPEWVGMLSAEQRQLWQSAQHAEIISGDYSAVEASIQKFLATKPPDGAKANAKYLMLLAKTHGLPKTEAAAQFAGSYGVWPDQFTDAGLPISQLISYQALRLMPDGTGMTEKLFKNTGWQIYWQPSTFSERFIAQVERVVKGTKLETNAAMLRSMWKTKLIARTVMEDFKDQHPQDTWTNTLFWVNSSAGNFVVMLNDWREMGYDQPPRGIAYCSMLYPERGVERVLAKTPARSDITPPPYALIEFEIAGKKITVAPDETVRATNSVLPVLGEASSTMDWFGFHAKPYPIQIRVLLASPEILYARQAQRTLMFGGLIVLSALAAVAGLFAASRAYNRQLQLNEMKSNFVSSVSHELRAPIASVRLMAENLERGSVTEPGKQHEYFRFIVQECRRLSALIENVLDFSRIEQGLRQYEFEPSDLEALTRQTVQLMEPSATDKQIRLETVVPEKSAVVEADGKAIQQALVNLIDNAIKHSPGGATVRVGLESGADSIQLWVEDSGEGIPVADHQRIFERFYRRGSELRRETQGAGIGLSIVKHIVDAHGGRIRVRSAVGEGSRFTIELPVKK